MKSSRVIIGPFVTEKAERQKAQRTYMLRVNPKATKIDVKNALRRLYDIEAASVRVINTGGKVRMFGRRGMTMRKRDPFKKVLITLAPKSKALDLTAFK